MATFVLKKYEEPKQTETSPELNTEKETPGVTAEGQTKEVTINVSGSISEIVANALNKVLVNKEITVEETADTQSEVKAISTEDINNFPLETLRSVKNSRVLLITTEGFKTKQEEWFLTNLEHSDVGKVFYSVESFVDYIVKEFNVNE